MVEYPTLTVALESDLSAFVLVSEKTPEAAQRLAAKRKKQPEGPSETPHKKFKEATAGDGESSADEEHSEAEADEEEEEATEVAEIAEEEADAGPDNHEEPETHVAATEDPLVAKEVAEEE